jgi:DNA-binding transcriptional regulator PaaX
MAVLFSSFLKHRYTKPQLTRAAYRLRKLRLVKVVRRDDGHTHVELTQAGKRTALRYALDEIELEKPYRWDGRWYMVLFDIPNEFRVARNTLRTRLKRLGLLPLQESVWVTPYPCREEIRFLAQMLNIGPFVKTAEVAALDEKDAAKLKEKFGIR